MNYIWVFVAKGNLFSKDDFTISLTAPSYPAAIEKLNALKLEIPTNYISLDSITEEGLEPSSIYSDMEN